MLHAIRRRCVGAFRDVVALGVSSLMECSGVRHCEPRSGAAIWRGGYGVGLLRFARNDVSVVMLRCT